ncbi:MAG: hypothetical protein LBF79_05645 [Dysgonamonadaceae bacterium]|jgi:hypothetical protein|nr:hypothetical protein [Dysgonamonadaceae bacterium]
MGTNGITNDKDIERYLDGWADMMVEIWKTKLREEDIINTGALINSLRAFVHRESGGNATKITHTFLRYGIYVEKGVGKGYSPGHEGYLDFRPTRRPQHWLSGKYWYSKNKLLIEMLNRTGKSYIKTFKSILSGSPE